MMQEPSPPPTRPDWPGRVLAALLFLWIIFVGSSVQLVAWSADQFSLANGNGFALGYRVAVPLIQSLLLLVPLVPLAWLWKRPRYRAVFRLWTFAALFIGLMTPAALPGRADALTVALLQTALSLLYAGVLLLPARPPAAANPTSGPVTTRTATLIALLAGPLLALPWVPSGALGSLLDTVLALAASAAFGIAAGVLLDKYWVRPFYRSGPGRGLDLFLGGLVAGAALFLLGSGFGDNGQQLLLMLLLPSLGWVVMGLSRAEGNRLPLALLIGLATAAPLLLLDPREMGLAVAFSLMNLLGWAFGAAAVAILVAWVLGAALLLFRWRREQRDDGRRDVARPVLVAATVLAWGVAVAVYLLAGNPGFYGEELFVILDDQADVTAAATTADLADRRAVVYRTLVSHADATQGDLRQALDRFGIDYTPYYLVNGIRVNGGPLLRLWLDSRPGVDRVLANPTLRPLPPETGPAFQPGTAPTGPPWNLTQIGADRVWNELGVTGAGIVIGHADSGVQWDHPELQDGYRGAAENHDYNWLDPWYGTTTPTDPGGHGTHTLGSVLGNDTGVAPDATWFGCANLARNLGNPGLYLDCMQFLLAPFPPDGDPFRDGDPARGADVLNNSWGCPALEGCDPDSLRPAVQAIRAAGIFMVVSAGNEGPQCESLDSPPAIYDAVFSVGAVNQSGALADFSSRGPVTVDGSERTKPDVVAPGVDILSSYPGNEYAYLQGTSMAGPHVAGVVALLWAANPNLRGDIPRTEQILIETADPLPERGPTCGGESPDNAAGYGQVDAYAAVQMALSP